MKPGDTIHAPIWLDGTEKPEQRTRFERDAAEAMTYLAHENRAEISPARWIVKLPGEEQVPPVPDHIQGPDVKLLVCEADVISVKPSTSQFLAELEPRDLQRLRGITRVAYRKDYPGRTRLTDRQCDTLINDLGPEAALSALERGSATLQ